MKTASRALVALLNTSTTFWSGEVWRFLLPTGQWLAWSGLDVDIHLPYRSVIAETAPALFWPGEVSGSLWLEEFCTTSADATLIGSPGDGGSLLPYEAGDTSVLLDGSTQYIRFQPPTSPRPDFRAALPRTYAVEMWLQPSAAQSGASNKMVLEIGYNFPWFQFYGDHTSGAFIRHRTVPYDASTPLWGTISAMSAGLTTASAHHLVFTYDGLRARLYIDGILRSEGEIDPPVNDEPRLPETGWVSIGAAHDGTEKWGGRIQAVALYPFPLSPETVLYHYQSGLGNLIYSRSGPPFGQSNLRSRIGVEVSELDLKIYPRPIDVLDTGVQLRDAFVHGVFDGAQAELIRIFSPTPPLWSELDTTAPALRIATPVGSLTSFSGHVDKIESGPSELVVTIRSLLSVLGSAIPRYAYTPGCNWDLYSNACGISKTGADPNGLPYQYVATAASLSQSESEGSPRSVIRAAYAPPNRESGYFNLGTITFMTGKNAYMRRTIKKHDGALFLMCNPFPYEPAIGDLFLVVPGCDKTLSACSGKFGNTSRFRGFPLIPGSNTQYGV